MWGTKNQIFIGNPEKTTAQDCAGFLSHDEIRTGLGAVNLDEKFPNYAKLLKLKIRKSEEWIPLLAGGDEKIKELFKQSEIPEIIVSRLWVF